MSYKKVKERLDTNKIIILDGGIGGELERIGAKMDKDLWAGKSAIKEPDKLFKVHKSYIDSGADIITSNTYAITPISMRQYGYEKFIEDWNKKSVQIALEAASKSGKDIAVAGSVSTSGSWDNLSASDIKPGFIEQLKILTDNGVDLIILEAMTSSNSTVETLIECSHKFNIPIWLSLSCAMNITNGKLMHGYQESLENSKAYFYDDLEKSLSKFCKMHKGPILIAHSDIKVTNEAVKILKKVHNNFIGAYPNNGYFEKPNWKFVDNVTSSNYLKEARSWVSSGAQIIGGCCGIGPDKIKAISILK